MKLSLAAILAFLPCVALAQSATNSTSTSTATQPFGSEQKVQRNHPSPEKELAWLTTKVGLSDTEQAQIKPVLVARDGQLEAISENASLTNEQKQEQSKAVVESANQQIEAVLDPGQLETFEEQ